MKFSITRIACTGAAVAVLAVAACAPTPESIASSYVSEVPYQSFTCQQLGEEQVRLGHALVAASGQQNTARSNDVAGWILLGLPAGSMSGQSIAPQIALYKGQLEAVQRASIRKSCTSQEIPIAANVAPSAAAIINPSAAR